jgi:hypothetical protein
LTLCWKIHSLTASGEPARFFFHVSCPLFVPYKRNTHYLFTWSGLWRQLHIHGVAFTQMVCATAPFSLARWRVYADLKPKMIFLKLYWQAYIPHIKGLCFDLRTGSVAHTHWLEHNSYWSDRNKDIWKLMGKTHAF